MCLWPVILKCMYFFSIIHHLTDMLFPVLKRNSKFTLLTFEGGGLSIQKSQYDLWTI